MKIAVLSLCRDRLSYSRHCFESLRKYAGCDFDHYVLDQGSEDGTADWLIENYDCSLVAESENLGISRGMNVLLDEVVPVDEYDVIVKYDNDCELTQPNTLRDVAELAFTGAILSPRILGLNNPPAHTREVQINGEVILDVPQIGGIFLAAPAWVYDDFRFNEHNPPWGNDDVEICHWFRGQGGTCGYVKRLGAWHYEGTSGQHHRFPDYFARTLEEGKLCL